MSSDAALMSEECIEKLQQTAAVNGNQSASIYSLFSEALKMEDKI